MLGRERRGSRQRAKPTARLGVQILTLCFLFFCDFNSECQSSSSLRKERPETSHPGLNIAGIWV
jgi:hypothetical protein